MLGARSRSSSTCASLGSSRKRASPAPSLCPWAKCPLASKSSIADRTSSPSATTAGAASRWQCSWKKRVSQESIIWREEWMPGREPSTRRSRFIRHWAFVLAAVALPAAAEDLLQVYREAQRYDAVYGAARFSLDAGRERIPQARALLLPSLGVTGSASRQDIDVKSSDQLIAPSFH